MIEISEEEFIMAIWSPVCGEGDAEGIREALYAQMIGLDEVEDIARKAGR